MLSSRLVKTGGFVKDIFQRFHGKRFLTRSDGEWLRNRLQEMGPTYIKIGQFMSARRDIFDKHIVEELQVLQDKVQPIPTNHVKEELMSVSGNFSAICIEPIASASIGQVHRARLKNGLDVVIKIKRSGIEKCLMEDISLLMGILNAMEFMGALNISETRDLLEDFKDFVLKEADYLNEVENMIEYGNIAGSIDYLRVPKPVKNQCNREMIVMNYLPSEKIGIVKHRLTNAERSALAYRIMDIFVTNLVQDGVVHGDPHEGNIGVVGDKIILYDFGSIINIDASLRNQMKQLIFELMTENIDGAVDVLRQMTVINIRDEEALRIYLVKYIQYFKSLDIKVFNFNDQENFKKLPVKIDGIIFRLIRAFGIIEGICKDLDPKFSYEKVFVKYVDMIFMDPTFVQYKIKSDVHLSK